MLKLLQCKNSRPTITGTELGVFYDSTLSSSHKILVTQRDLHNHPRPSSRFPPREKTVHPSCPRESEQSVQGGRKPFKKMEEESAAQSAPTFLRICCPSLCRHGGKCPLGLLLPGLVLRVRLGTVFAA